MSAKNFTEDIKEALRFFEIEDVPRTIKDLNSMFRKLSLRYHPDKNSGSAESTQQYQYLQTMYKRLGDFVLSNDENDNAGVEEEERFNRDIFRELFKHFNKDKTNMYCHVVVIEQNIAHLWKTVMDNHLGTPETQQYKHIYKARQYTVNDESLVSTRPITVTLYNDVQEPKIHIQSCSQVHNGYYVLYELPRMYQEVRKLSPAHLSGLGSNVKEAEKPKRGRGRPGKNINNEPQQKMSSVQGLICKYEACDFSSKIKRTMEGHYNSAHIYDQQRELENQVDEVIENEEEEEDEEESEALVEPDPSPTAEEEKKMYETKLKEKEGLILQLQEKIRSLAVKNRDLKKENDKMKSDVAEIKTEKELTDKQVQEYCGENTILKSKVHHYQLIEVTNNELLEEYNKLKKTHTDLVNKMKQSPATDRGDEEDDDTSNIEVLAHYKKLGSRRSTNSERPVTNTQPTAKSKVFSCNKCIYKTIDEQRLKAHYRDSHITCDLCDITFGTPVEEGWHELRQHNIHVHKAPGGTAQ